MTPKYINFSRQGLYAVQDQYGYRPATDAELAQIKSGGVQTEEIKTDPESVRRSISRYSGTKNFDIDKYLSGVPSYTQEGDRFSLNTPTGSVQVKADSLQQALNTATAKFGGTYSAGSAFFKDPDEAARLRETKQFFAPNATGGLTEGIGGMSAQERVDASAERKSTAMKADEALTADQPSGDGNRTVSMVQGGQTVDGQFQADPNYQARVAQQAQAAPVTPDPRTGQYALQPGENEDQRIQRLKKLGLYDPVKELSDIKERALSIQSAINNLPAETPQAMQTYEGISQKFGLPPAPQMQSAFFSDPIGTIKGITQQIFQMAGMDQANNLITDISDELEDLENRRDAEIRNINDDPWLTEGVRLRRIQKAEEKWADEIDNRVNKLRLLESVRDDARQQAQFALSTAIGLYDSERRFQQDQIQMYYDQAQREFDNNVKLAQLQMAQDEANRPDPGTSDMQEYMFAVENGQFNGSFIDWKASVAASTRAPSDGGGVPGEQLYSGLSSSTATAVRSLVGKYSGEALVQNFATIQEGYNFSQAISSQTQNPADDQALIYALAKALDPGSVVREGEYATAQKYAQSWVAAYGKGVTQAIAGTGFLSETARNNIKKVIETKYRASQTSYDNLNNQYVSRINNLTGRGDGSQFLVDYTTPTQSGGLFQEPAPGGRSVAPVQVFDEVVSQPSQKSGGIFSNFLTGLLFR